MMLRPLRRRYFEAPDILFRYTSGAPGLTTTRQTPATYRDRTGILRTAAPGVLRTTWQDGRPYALVEGGARNEIVDSAMASAAVGTLPDGWAALSGVVSVDVVGVGAEDGIPYIDLRVVGDGSSNVDWLQVSPAVDTSGGEGWTYTIAVRQVGGSLDGIADLWPRVIVAGASNQTLPSLLDALAAPSLGRAVRSHVLTAGAGATSVRPLLRLSRTGPFDVTLRIGAPQLEPGPLATSWIPTDGAPATRDRDLVSVDYAHAPGSLAVLTAGREAGLGQVNAAYEWQIGGTTNLDARSLGIRHTASAGMLRLWLGSGSARTESSVPVVPMGAEYQRLAILDVQGTQARVRLLQRYREMLGSGPWIDASGSWSSWLDVSALLAQGWESPHLTVGNVREGSRAGRLQLSDLIALDLRGRDAEALTIDAVARRFGL